jgi:uncharacterized protein (DUF1697 family)
MTTYVAFLRGIGGTNTKIKMQVLKEAFEGMGFRNVRTVIASGNVIFDAKATRENNLERSIERALPEAVGFGADTFVYTFDDLQKLARSSLVKKMTATPKTRPMVTFLKEAPKGRATFSGKGFEVLGHSGRAILSVMDASGSETPELMRVLDREFGKMTTTRSWLTIEKILQQEKKK